MSRIWLVLGIAGLLLVSSRRASLAPACCPAPPRGKAVVNADQTVIIVWDAAHKTQHFIRKASFKGDAADFGFLVPTPAQPELEESGSEVFSFLAKLTAPAKEVRPRPEHCSICCGEEVKSTKKSEVSVLAEKSVAGFHAVVLQTKSSDALAQWLKEHGYAFSPEVQTWAKPYVEAGWKITALRVEKDKRAADDARVATPALRMTFKTDRPLFPYREPDPKAFAQTLSAQKRLLRIFFLAEARYRGEIVHSTWSGNIAWANRLSPENRTETLRLLKIKDVDQPAGNWLTEFEDDWAYAAAPADVTFSPDPIRGPITREPIIEYTASPWPTDPTAYGLVALVVAPPLVRRFRRGKGRDL
jgi:hypothetical protein